MYFVYMVKCNDGSYYTGVTTHLMQRVKAHNSSAKGAKYTRSRRPVHLVYSELSLHKSAALSREYALKRLSHAEKAAMAEAWLQYHKSLGEKAEDS